MLIGIYDDIIIDKHKNTLCKFLTFCAIKCVLLKWLMDKAPSKALWHRVILEYVSLDYLTCASYSKDVMSLKMGSIFFKYIG